MPTPHTPAELSRAYRSLLLQLPPGLAGPPTREARAAGMRAWIRSRDPAALARLGAALEREVRRRPSDEHWFARLSTAIAERRRAASTAPNTPSTPSDRSLIEAAARALAGLGPEVGYRELVEALRSRADLVEAARSTEAAEAERDRRVKREWRYLGFAGALCHAAGPGGSELAPLDRRRLWPAMLGEPERSMSMLDVARSSELSERYLWAVALGSRVRPRKRPPERLLSELVERFRPEIGAFALVALLLRRLGCDLTDRRAAAAALEGERRRLFEERYPA